VWLISSVAMSKPNCSVNDANCVLRNELLHVVVEAEIDHVEHSIASHRRRHALVQPTRTKAVFLYDLSNFGKSWWLLTQHRQKWRDITSTHKINSKKVYFKTLQTQSIFTIASVMTTVIVNNLLHIFFIIAMSIITSA